MKRRFKGRNKGGTVPLSSDPHDRIAIKLSCFEPAGHVLDISEGTLLRHVLATGATGSGKSSVLGAMLSDLIAYRATEPDHKAGLVIMDNEWDDTIERVRHLAAQVGRENDVCHLSPASGWYRPLGKFTEWNDLERAVSRLISAARFIEIPGGENRYWAETTKILVECALVVVLVTIAKFEFTDILHFMGQWIISGHKLPAPVVARIELFRGMSLAARSKLSAPVQSKLDFALASLDMWENLDSRAKSILRSCVATVLGPFQTFSGLHLWEEGRGDMIDPALVLDGKIIVVSIPAAVDPELAITLGRLIKMDFYQALQRRSYHPGDRIAGIFQDEFPLSVTAGSSRWSDITNLATLRSKGGFLVAATQGLANLEMVVGPRAVNALLLNFGSTFFFRSHEAALDLWAGRLIGTKENVAEALPEANNTWPAHPLDKIFSSLRPDNLACPPGGLARLQTHQAFISLATGFVTKEPLWLAPNHLELPTTKVPPPKEDKDMTIISEVRSDLTATEEVPEKDFPF